MTKDLIVRTASQFDIERWLALFEAVAAEGKWIGAESPVDKDERREIFDRIVNSSDAVVLIAEVDGQLVGVLNGRIHRGVVDLGLIVDKGWRGKGVGSRLIRTCLSWAADHRAHKVFLEVRPHNTDAIALYHKFGFVEEGRLRRHYRRRNGELWDAVQMGLVLDLTSPGSPYQELSPPRG